jgi:hypothetical protein
MYGSHNPETYLSTGMPRMSAKPQPLTIKTYNWHVAAKTLPQQTFGQNPATTPPVHRHAADECKAAAADNFVPHRLQVGAQCGQGKVLLCNTLL